MNTCDGFSGFGSSLTDSCSCMKPLITPHMQKYGGVSTLHRYLRHKNTPLLPRVPVSLNRRLDVPSGLLSNIGSVIMGQSPHLLPSYSSLSVSVLPGSSGLGHGAGYLHNRFGTCRRGLY